MRNSNLDPEYRKALERLETQLQIEDEIAKASEQFEMQELMQKAYENGLDYGKGYSEGFIVGVRFIHDKEAASAAWRKQKYDELYERWHRSQ